MLARVSISARLAYGCGSPNPHVRLELPGRSRLVLLATCPSAEAENDPPGGAPRATHGAVAVTSFERALSFGVRARSMAVTA